MFPTKNEHFDRKYLKFAGFGLWDNFANLLYIPSLTMPLLNKQIHKLYALNLYLPAVKPILFVRLLWLV